MVPLPTNLKDVSVIALVYVSAARKLFDEAALSILLAQCQRNNARLGVTGMLLYADGNFMQVVEGDAAAVDALVATIAQDPRHSRMTVLLRMPIEQRQFAGWSMALRRLADLPPADRVHCTALMATTMTARNDDPNPVLKMLESFRNSMG
jgi:hypothetical protein